MKQVMTPTVRRQAAVAVASMALVSAAVLTSAQGGAPQQQQAAVNPAAPTKALVPVAASTLATRPDGYVGEFVTVSATVERSLSKLAFTIDQDRTKATGQEVLVLAQRMSDPVEANGQITVIGEFMKFDPKATPEKAKAKNITIDAPADVLASWAGKPVLLASSVINARMVDLGRFLPPPMTAEETAFDKAMKSVAPAFGALRKAIESSNAAQVAEHSATLTRAFADTEAFMKARRSTEALKWAQDARLNVLTIEKAGASAKWDEAKAAGDTLAKACQTCHTAQRERLEDGSYRAKPAPAPAGGAQ